MGNENSVNDLNFIKSKIMKLVDNGHFDLASKLLKSAEELFKDNLELLSIKAVILILQGKILDAENLLRKGLKANPFAGDLLYNLAYIYEQKGELQTAYDLYIDAKKLIYDDSSDTDEALNRINKKVPGIKTRKRIAFFVKSGMDSFLADIIKGISSDYITKKIIVRNTAQIDSGMKWADICWFEWCDELLIYGSNLNISKEKKIICRLHRYEVFTEQPSKVNWSHVDKLLIVTDHLKNLLKVSVPEIESYTSIETFKNGVDLNRFKLEKREKGFNIAYIGYIHMRKNPVLLLQILKSLSEKDSKYKLFIAGKFQDSLAKLYFQYQITEMKLENNVFFEGWQSDINQWLKNKNYVLSTSIHESFGYGIAEAMTRGIKPIIHNFPFAKEIWPEKYMFNTVQEAVDLITEIDYNSKEYRRYIEDHYSMERQLEGIKDILDKVEKMPLNKNVQFDYAGYWNLRLGKKFDIESVGYIGLGEIYNEKLYKTRIKMLDFLVENIFSKLECMKILELGPGIGVFTEYFFSKGVSEYSAVDISTAAVEKLSEKYGGYKFIEGDISDHMVYDACKKYDLVFGADVLLHLTDEEKYRQALKNVESILEDDGTIILYDPITLTGTASNSPHVVIRDYSYVNDLLKEINLEIALILPVSFFMNYPFDSKLLGDAGNNVFKIFDNILKIFTNPDIDNHTKEIMGNYLYVLDKLCLVKHRKGLSEKILVIKRKDSKGEGFEFSINDVWSRDEIRNEYYKSLKTMESCLELFNNDALINISRDIYSLLRDPLSINEVYNTLNNFPLYSPEHLNMYDMKTAKLLIGKRERLTGSTEVIEYILRNEKGRQLIITGVLYEGSSGKITYPDYVAKSDKLDDIHVVTNKIIYSLNIVYEGNMGSFILDEGIRKDVSENRLAYIWERGIPGTQFMPTLGYIGIINRYKFAARFIDMKKTVLDAASGYGYGTSYLSHYCQLIYGLDLAESNILFGESSFYNENLRWVKGDVADLPFDEDYFDTYISFETLEHLTANKVKKYLEESKRVLKKNGTFLLSTPNKNVRKEVNNPFHVKEYTYGGIDGILKEHFSSVHYYSVVGYEVTDGIEPGACDIIAVCRG